MRERKKEIRHILLAFIHVRYRESKRFIVAEQITLWSRQRLSHQVLRTSHSTIASISPKTGKHTPASESRAENPPILRHAHPEIYIDKNTDPQFSRHSSSTHRIFLVAQSPFNAETYNSRCPRTTRRLPRTHFPPKMRRITTRNPPGFASMAFYRSAHASSTRVLRRPYYSWR